MEYIYLGDGFTDPALRPPKRCKAVRRQDGKCKRGKNGNFLVEFEDGKQAIVLGRLLRKIVPIKVPTRPLSVFLQQPC